MAEILKTIWAGFTGSAWLDQLNLALGILGVGLMIRRTLWAFPVGLLSVGVQGASAAGFEDAAGALAALAECYTPGARA